MINSNRILPGLLAIGAAAWFYSQVGPQQTQEPSRPDDPFWAAYHGDLKSVKEHLEKDPKLLVKTRGGGLTILHYAADGNQPQIIRYLVRKGAKVDSLGTTGSYTPLFTAAMSARPRTGKSAKVLIELGANPKWRSGGRTTTSSVLDMAVTRGHADFVKLLLKKGVSPFTYARYRGTKYLLYTSLHKACEGPIAAYYLSHSGFDPKEYADNHKVIEALLPIVKDINIKDSDGRAPLHIAAMCGHSDIVAYLLNKYPKVQLNAQDDARNTPLHLAVNGAADFAKRFPKHSLKDRLETIKVLLKHKPDRTVNNLFGQNPRDVARATGNKAIIELLK
jgi:E3 ubiquitin-protein ligase mind-bomb